MMIQYDTPTLLGTIRCKKLPRWQIIRYAWTRFILPPKIWIESPFALFIIVLTNEPALLVLSWRNNQKLLYLCRRRTSQIHCPLNVCSSSQCESHLASARTCYDNKHKHPTQCNRGGNLDTDTPLCHLYFLIESYFLFSHIIKQKKGFVLNMRINTFHEAIALNNEAVSFLVDGKEQHAMQKFKRSLTAMKASLCGINTFVLAGKACDEPPSSLSVQFTSVMLPECKQEQFYIYNRAIVMRCRSSSSLPDDERDNAICVAILFNMALLYQLQARRSISSSPQTKALRMYEMCNELLNICCKKSNDSVASLLTIACLNNMSLLLADMGQCEESRIVLGALHQWISKNQSFNKSMLFDDVDIRGIILNVIVMRLPGFAAGAA